jgi:hypothetical protein
MRTNGVSCEWEEDAVKIRWMTQIGNPLPIGSSIALSPGLNPAFHK